MTSGDVARLQISWQAQHFVNLEVQISWQARHFVNLEVLRGRRADLHTAWQAHHFVLSDAHLSLALTLTLIYWK